MREGGIAMRAVDFIRNAGGAVAMHGFEDAGGEDVGPAPIPQAGTDRHGKTGTTKAVVAVGEEIASRDALIARAEDEGEPLRLAYGNRDVGFEQVLIGAGYIISQRSGGAERCAFRDAVGISLSSNIVAVGVEDEILADRAEALPLHDHTVATVARLDRIIDGRRHSRGCAIDGGVDGVLHIVIAGGQQHADT